MTLYFPVKFKKTSAVYRILNTVTGNDYVGSTTNVQERFRQHFALLRTGKHYNKEMQADFNLHGESPFGLEILELLQGMSKFNRILTEQQYIYALQPKYNVSVPDYNKKLSIRTLTLIAIEFNKHVETIKRWERKNHPMMKHRLVLEIIEKEKAA